MNSPMTEHPTDALRNRLADFLNAYKADPFSTGESKVDRLLEIIAMNAARTTPIDDEGLAQRLQDHMEQHHGACLKASEWDAAVKASLPTPVIEEELVEKVARAICAADPDNDHEPDYVFDGTIVWKFYEAQARAAIRAVVA